MADDGGDDSEGYCLQIVLFFVGARARKNPQIALRAFLCSSTALA